MYSEISHNGNGILSVCEGRTRGEEKEKEGKVKLEEKKEEKKKGQVKKEKGKKRRKGKKKIEKGMKSKTEVIMLPFVFFTVCFSTCKFLRSQPFARMLRRKMGVL